jgi:glycine/D-amino acid oxidase-like deaminating enzyme
LTVQTDGTSSDYQVAVIGGGLVGAGIAWGLARAGQRVVILDEGDLAVRASRGNFALVWVQGKGFGLAPYSVWTLASARAWPSLALELREQTGVDVSLDQPGGFHVCLSDAEFESRARMLKQFHAQPGVAPYQTAMLGRNELIQYLPDIGPEVVGASWCEFDGHVNSLRLFRAFHEGFLAHGGRYVPNRPVESITRVGGLYEIRSNQQLARAEKIVLAAGNANATLAPMVGLHAPMKPERGQIVVTERVRPFLRHPLSTIRQTDEGSVMIGDSREEGIDPAAMNMPINTVMAHRAVRIFPLLAQVNIVRTWRAIRVMPADGFPIYEASDTHPGAFLTTCHSGVTLAAAHALLLAPMIAKGQLDAQQLAPFSARRFHVQAHS